MAFIKLICACVLDENTNKQLYDNLSRPQR